MHKAKCRLNTRREALANPALGFVDDKLKALRAFTGKHRPTLCECGVRALDLGRNPSNAETKFFLVRVRERAGAKKVELSYEFVDAQVVDYDSLFPSLAAEMKGVLDTMNVINKQQGLDGTLFVVLHDMESGVRNNAPVGFSKQAAYSRPMPYLEMLSQCLNEGIVY